MIKIIISFTQKVGPGISKITRRASSCTDTQ